MTYSYESERPRLFTEEGATFFLKVRDNVKALLEQAGAFRFDHVRPSGGYDSFMLIAALDRLVEMKEIEECPRTSWTQFKVYSTPQRHDY